MPKTKMSPDSWKLRAAQAINKPELASGEDEDLLDAIDKHLALVRDFEAIDDEPEGTVYGIPAPIAKDMGLTKTTMPAAPAVANTAAPTANPPCVMNEEQKGALFRGLVNEAKVSQGLSISDAIKHVQILRPDLYPRSEQPQRFTKEELGQQDERRRTILHLVNEKLSSGAGGTGSDAYEICFNAVKLERPDLFANMAGPIESRESKISRLVNEKIRAGGGSFDACYNSLKVDCPDLFTNVANATVRK